MPETGGFKTPFQFDFFPPVASHAFRAILERKQECIGRSSGSGEFAKMFKAWRKALSTVADINRPVCESDSHLLLTVFVLVGINLFVIGESFTNCCC